MQASENRAQQLAKGEIAAVHIRLSFKTFYSTRKRKGWKRIREKSVTGMRR